MARPPHLALALAVAAVAALVVPLRSLHVFDAARGSVDLVTLTYVAQVAWSLVAVVGFAAVGYTYATRVADGASVTGTVVVAGVAAFVGVMAGNLALVLSADLSWTLSLPAVVAFMGTKAVLDATTFGLLTVGGFALGAHEPP